MVFLLKVQERTRGLPVTPELAAILISVLVLITAVLRPANTMLIGTAICLLTWLWTWRMLLDPDIRVRIASAVSSPISTFSWILGANRTR
jgi:hypothetical protein